MCLIIQKEANQPISADYLADVFSKNSDGWGILAYPEPGKLDVIRGMSLVEIQKAVAERNNQEMAIHFRWATHGAKDLTMTHPFHVTKDIWLMHNGIMSNAPKTDILTWSDTMRVAQLIIKPILESVANPNEFMRTPGFRATMEAIAGSGNKLLFADSQGIIRMSESLWTKTLDNVIISNGHSSTIKEANGVKPLYEPKSYTYTPNNVHTSHSRGSNVMNAPLTDKTKKSLLKNDYNDAVADAKSIPIETVEDMFAFVENYPDLGLSTMCFIIQMHALQKEKAALLKSVYLGWLFNEKPAKYNEYLAVKGNGYYLQDKKVYEIKPKKKEADSCCSLPSSEVTTAKGSDKTNDSKENAA